jgi:hypothetical protein
MGRAVRASCPRPPTVSQRRDSDSPHGISGAERLRFRRPASLRIPAPLADLPKRPCLCARPIVARPWGNPNPPTRGILRSVGYSPMGRAVPAADAPLSLLRCGPADTSVYRRSPACGSPSPSVRHNVAHPAAIRIHPFASPSWYDSIEPPRGVVTVDLQSAGQRPPR